ncbi:hypothetical protein DIURU_001323 [Diutina rugosa]|uniref:Uncharacterized protein n=1 Tax=Diutina rugosa TaxID=5481 RepID=A0A642UV97_DIURU|nr:uncharacterized protein DIURU_001323 [Diutina rugosa]KAA8905946.1 hypothetical protein DIURU_001323 [Diutina rugosa]
MDCPSPLPVFRCDSALDRAAEQFRPGHLQPADLARMTPVMEKIQTQHYGNSKPRVVSMPESVPLNKLKHGDQGYRVSPEPSTTPPAPEVTEKVKPAKPAEKALPQLPKSPVNRPTSAAVDLATFIDKRHFTQTPAPVAPLGLPPQCRCRCQQGAPHAIASASPPVRTAAPAPSRLPTTTAQPATGRISETPGETSGETCAETYADTAMPLLWKKHRHGPIDNNTTHPHKPHHFFPSKPFSNDDRDSVDDNPSWSPPRQSPIEAPVIAIDPPYHEKLPPNELSAVPELNRSPAYDSQMPQDYYYPDNYLYPASISDSYDASLRGHFNGSSLGPWIGGGGDQYSLRGSSSINGYQPSLTSYINYYQYYQGYADSCQESAYSPSVDTHGRRRLQVPSALRHIHEEDTAEEETVDNETVEEEAIEEEVREDVKEVGVARSHSVATSTISFQPPQGPPPELRDDDSYKRGFGNSPSRTPYRVRSMVSPPPATQRSMVNVPKPSSPQQRSVSSPEYYQDHVVNEQYPQSPEAFDYHGARLYYQVQLERQAQQAMPQGMPQSRSMPQFPSTQSMPQPMLQPSHLTYIPNPAEPPQPPHVYQPLPPTAHDLAAASGQYPTLETPQISGEPTPPAPPQHPHVPEPRELAEMLTCPPSPDVNLPHQPHEYKRMAIPKEAPIPEEGEPNPRDEVPFDQLPAPLEYIQEYQQQTAPVREPAVYSFKPPSGDDDGSTEQRRHLSDSMLGPASRQPQTQQYRQPYEPDYDYTYNSDEEDEPLKPKSRLDPKRESVEQFLKRNGMDTLENILDKYVNSSDNSIRSVSAPVTVDRDLPPIPEPPQQPSIQVRVSKHAPTSQLSESPVVALKQRQQVRFDPNPPPVHYARRHSESGSEVSSMQSPQVVQKAQMAQRKSQPEEITDESPPPAVITTDATAPEAATAPPKSSYNDFYKGGKQQQQQQQQQPPAQRKSIFAKLVPAPKRTSMIEEEEEFPLSPVDGDLRAAQAQVEAIARAQAQAQAQARGQAQAHAAAQTQTKAQQFQAQAQAKAHGQALAHAQEQRMEAQQQPVKPPVQSKQAQPAPRQPQSPAPMKSQAEAEAEARAQREANGGFKSAGGFKSMGTAFKKSSSGGGLVNIIRNRFSGQFSSERQTTAPAPIAAPAAPVSAVAAVFAPGPSATSTAPLTNAPAPAPSAAPGPVKIKGIHHGPAPKNRYYPNRADTTTNGVPPPVPPKTLDPLSDKKIPPPQMIAEAFAHDDDDVSLLMCRTQALRLNN